MASQPPETAELQLQESVESQRGQQQPTAAEQALPDIPTVFRMTPRRRRNRPANPPAQPTELQQLIDILKRQSEQIIDLLGESLNRRKRRRSHRDRHCEESSSGGGSRGASSSNSESSGDDSEEKARGSVPR